MNNKRIRFAVCFFLLFFITNGIFAQQSEYIAGRLFDSETNEPLVFANIRIKERTLGIITNIDGSFKIPLIYKEYGDIVEISSMGYETKEISISEFVLSEINIVKLDPGAIDLQEAVVKAKDKSRNLSAKQIVQRAIDAIPKNFPSTSFSTIGYYRDYQYENETYINLSEAILEVFDQGFDQLDDSTSETRLFNLALNTDFKQDSMARAAYDYKSYGKIIKKAHLDVNGGNEFRILRIHDAIRNYNTMTYDFVGTLKTDLVEKHFFRRSKDIYTENGALYTIKFWVYYPNYRANGTIYIAKSDYSIHKLEYTMYDDKKWNKERKKNKHGHQQKVIFDISTEYRKIKDQMYLNYISFHNEFTLNLPPVFKVDYITVNKDRLCFVVEYSDRPVAKAAIHVPNYELEYEKRRVKIKKAERLKNTVYLYPMLEEEKITKMMNEISVAEQDNIDLNELIEIKIKNVRDTIGNLVNKWTQKDFQQYREFFVQRVKPDTRAPLDSNFMNKSKPIFENQPIMKPKEYKDYWMNTPLNSKIN